MQALFNKKTIKYSGGNHGEKKQSFRNVERTCI